MDPLAAVQEGWGLTPVEPVPCRCLRDAPSTPRGGGRCRRGFRAGRQGAAVRPGARAGRDSPPPRPLHPALCEHQGSGGGTAGMGGGGSACGQAWLSRPQPGHFSAPGPQSWVLGPRLAWMMALPILECGPAGSWRQAWDGPSSGPWIKMTAKPPLLWPPGHFSGGRAWRGRCCRVRHPAGLEHSLGVTGQGDCREGRVGRQGLTHHCVVPVASVRLADPLPVASEPGSSLLASVSPSMQVRAFSGPVQTRFWALVKQP